MKKTRKLTIGFDIDDTLIPFTQTICDRCEKEFGHKFPYEEVVWGFSNYKPEETAFVHALFRDEEFINSIPMSQDVIDLIKTVYERGHDILFVTSTYSNVMTTRALYLYEKMDFIHPRNYIMTGRKDCVKLDILFDDCLAHIQSSIAGVPVLVNTPWNAGYPGYVRIDGPKDYINIINMVEKGVTRQEIYKMQNPKVLNHPCNVVIVGGSGAGKTVISKKIIELSDSFQKIVTNTTRDAREGEICGVDYNFCSKREFKKLIAANELIENTIYAGNYYGTSKNSVDMILKNGKNALIVMDIDGAMRMKEEYPSNTYIVFITRDKEDIIRSIMERDVSLDEKVKRIAQLDTDVTGAEKCDYLIENKGIEETAQEIIDLF